ncbi:hypothetical protein THAOC_22428, partial [Thalassiosira oceanica]
AEDVDVGQDGEGGEGAGGLDGGDPPPFCRAMGTRHGAFLLCPAGLWGEGGEGTAAGEGGRQRSRQDVGNPSLRSIIVCTIVGNL